MIGVILERYTNLSIVGEAVNGMEAVYMAAVLKPHIIMPKMDGIQATKKIKAAQPTIIGLSVINDKHVTEAMEMAGAEAILLKYDLNKLHDAMRSWSADALNQDNAPFHSTNIISESTLNRT